MSHSRIRITGTIDTLAHAQTVKQSLRDELATKDVFREDELEHVVNEEGTVSFVFDVRLNTVVDRSAIQVWFTNQVRDHPQAKDWFRGTIEFIEHRCFNYERDEDVVDELDADDPSVVIASHTKPGRHPSCQITRKTIDVPSREVSP